MKASPTIHTATLVLLLPAAPLLAAGTAPPPNASTSANYCLVPASNSTGGGALQSSGGAIKADVSVADAGTEDTSMETNSGYSQVPGFIGQNNDVVGFQVDSTPSTIQEGGTRQLIPRAVMDDSTLVDLDVTEVSWSVLTGPLTGIDAAGIATAGIVYEDTLATVQGNHDSYTDDYTLTVQNIGVDDYLSYGGDGIDDDWQVNYFGIPPNADAGPGENPDKDPHDNLFEFLTGFSPVDNSEFFQFSILGKSGTTADLQINKVISDRTYTIKAGTDLQTFGETVATLTPSAEELDAPVEDTNAASGAKFYRIEVTKP